MVEKHNMGNSLYKLGGTRSKTAVKFKDLTAVFTYPDLVFGLVRVTVNPYGKTVLIELGL